MSEDYTPTTGAIRSGYAYYAPDRDVVEMALAFDRWLTAHDAEIRTASIEAARGWLNNLAPAVDVDAVFLHQVTGADTPSS